MQKLLTFLILLSLSSSGLLGTSDAILGLQAAVSMEQFEAYQAKSIAINEPLIQESSRRDDKGQFVISSDVRIFIAEIASDSTLTYTLFRQSDDQTELKPIIADKVVFSKLLVYRQPEKFSIVLDQLTQGQYELQLEATNHISKARVIGDERKVFFTVKTNDIVEGWESAPSPIGYKADVDETQVLSDGRMTDEGEAFGKLTAGFDFWGLFQNSTPQPKVILTGQWNLFNRTNEFVPLQKAQVELLYRNQFYMWRKLAVSYTDEKGNFSLKYTTPQSANLWEIRIKAENPEYGEVQNKSSDTYYQAKQYDNLRDGGDIGSWLIKKGSMIELAFWSFNDIIRAKDKLQTYLDPGIAKIVLDESKNNSSYYQPGGKIYLRKDAPQNITTTLHELGHNYMYNLYGAMSQFICPSPHTMFQITYHESCAWEEGWADMFSLYVNDNSRFYFNANDYIDMENVSFYENKGDHVEGNVVAALWDLYDKNNDGRDTRSYPFSQIYLTMAWKRVYSFSDFWSKWKAYGYDRNAKYSLWQNSIFYN